MQRIRGIPRLCYSSCKGTINKLKTRKYEQGISGAFLTTLVCFCALSIGFRFKATPYSCQIVCTEDRNDSVADVGSGTSCSQVCVLDIEERESVEYSRFVANPTARALLLVVAIIYVFAHNITNNMRQQICLASPQGVTWQMVLFRQLPLKTITKFVSTIFTYQPPYPINVVCAMLFVRVMKVNMQEARDENLRNYKSISQLFTRTLKDDARPIDLNYEMVCPADSKVISVGGVLSDVIEQIKDVTYSLKTFLGRGVLPDCKQGHSLFSAVFYLSPGDYHHFHSPTEWNANLCRHFKGDLLSVSPWVVRHIPGIFALNERVLVSGGWRHGYCSVTAVGALNVGSIDINICKDLITNVDSRDRYYVPYTDRRLAPTKISKGERVGGFNFGSTIVLIFEAPNDFKFIIKPGDRVKYGQALGTSE